MAAPAIERATRGANWSDQSRTRWLTPRTPSRKTYGPVVAGIAEQLGKPLTPLQRYIADVANEVDSRGRFCYRSVVILAPRRTGKSALMEPIMTHRGEQRRCEMAMTAATGEFAVELFQEITQDLIESPVADRFARTKSQGYAKLEFTQTGSMLRAVTPSPKIGHSKSLRLMWVDEFWSHTAAQLKAMRAGYRPAFLTTGGQEFLTSTAGTEQSDAFIQARMQGRADVADGRNSGRAFFDVCAPQETPEGVPLADLSDQELLELLADNHPSVGHLFTREDLIELMLLDLEDLGGRSGLLRAYGNLTDDGSADVLLSLAAWTAAGSDELLVPPGRVGVGVAVDPAGYGASIAVGNRDTGGLAVVEHVRADSGTAWIVNDCKSMPDAGVFAVNATGAGRDIADALERAGLEVLRIPQATTTAASSALVRGVTGGTVKHRKQPQLQASVEVASTQRVGGGWAWTAGTPLAGACLALWAADHLPAADEDEGEFRMFVARRRS